MDKNLKKVDSEKKFLADWEDGEFRCLVLQGPFSLCAYIGVKQDHILFRKNYINLLFVDCNGGLTFSKLGKNDPWPRGYWWFGWDYAHIGDRGWTVEKVIAEFPDVLRQLREINPLDI